MKRSQIRLLMLLMLSLGCLSRDEKAAVLVFRATRDRALGKTHQLLKAALAGDTKIVMTLAADSAAARQLLAIASTDRPLFEAASRGMTLRRLEANNCIAHLYFEFPYQGQAADGLAELRLLGNDWRIVKISMPVAID